MNADLAIRYRAVRAATEALAAPLSPEDQQLQSMPECSPTKWHRGHTTWFFETFLLAPRGVPPVEPSWAPLFNSYYDAAGPRLARPRRGMLSRPTAAEVGAWRRAVDERMEACLDALDPRLVELGLAHEEQHQELILTDILHAFSENPLRPSYGAGARRPSPSPQARWVEHAGGLVSLGGTEGFDNEGPRHPAWLEPFALANGLVTVADARAFIAAGGYGRSELWLAEGYDWARAEGIGGPGYVRDGVVFDLEGERALDDTEPVAFLSYYEADALARFLGARLPTEAEWEVGARTGGLSQLYSDVWQWTSSAYGPYPGFVTPPGALGEYNAKFMVNQLVLRGGSRFTPIGHSRPTYRNYWHPNTRFQVAGLRLAKSL